MKMSKIGTQLFNGFSENFFPDVFANYEFGKTIFRNVILTLSRQFLFFLRFRRTEFIKCCIFRIVICALFFDESFSVCFLFDFIVSKVARKFFSFPRTFFFRKLRGELLFSTLGTFSTSFCLPAIRYITAL